MLTLYYTLLLLIIASVSDTVSGNYCKLPSNSFQAYNIGKNIFIGSGQSRLWNYNLEQNYVINQKLHIADVFGQNMFEWVDTAVSFNFEKCDHKSDFCDITNKARNIVLAVGQKKNDSRKYGYIAYRMDSNGELGPITQNEMVWGLSTRGTVSGNFWVSLPGYLVHESSVFVPSRNELYVSVYDTSSATDSKYHLMRRKLKSNGEWDDEWTDVADIGFAGMFYANGRVFAMDRKQMIHEFQWNNEKLGFDAKVWSAKQFFNCYRNSTLFTSESIDTTIATTTTTTNDFRNQGNEGIISTTITTTTNDNEIIPESTQQSVTEEQTDDYIDETERDEQTVSDAKTSDTNLQTESHPELMVTSELSVNTEPSAAEHSKPVSNGFLWSTGVLIALIFIILFIVILVFIIFRKRRTKTLYISASTNDTKPTQTDKTQSETSIKTIRSKLVP